MEINPTLEINLKAIEQNILYYKKLHPQSSVGIVVKANAYGLGAKKIVQFCHNKNLADMFFVAYLSEALEILPYTTKDIIVLHGCFDINQMELCASKGITPVINSLQQYKIWKQWYDTWSQHSDMDVVLHFDTGLNRYGLRESDLQSIDINHLQAMPIKFIMSHLACASNPGHFLNDTQLKKFTQIKKFFPAVPCSLSASDGALLGKKFELDILRLGAGIYGINPSMAQHHRETFKSVISLYAYVIQICKLKKGEFAGYDKTFTASCDMQIALVSIGYGDGIPTSFSNFCNVWFKRGDVYYSAKAIGYISMDIIICDVSNVPNTALGERISIINSHYTINDFAYDAKLNPREVLLQIRKERTVIDYIIK